VLTANSPTFTLKEFPKQVVEIYLKGGSQPAIVLMRKFYPRGQPRWHDRAIAWLEKNVNVPLEVQTPNRLGVVFKVGDFGAVGPQNSKPAPGAQVVRVEVVLNEGRVLRVVDAWDPAKTYYVLANHLIPIPTPT
jgi:hypothetical protein